MTFLPGVQGPACWGPGQQEGQVRGWKAYLVIPVALAVALQWGEERERGESAPQRQVGC